MAYITARLRGADHADSDLDRLMMEAIEATKPEDQVMPGMEGAIFEL